MAWKRKYCCKTCGYETEVYEGRGLFRQQITAMSCPDCKTIQNIVVGGIIADVAPSYRSEVGRLCLQCGSDQIRIWNRHWRTRVLDVKRLLKLYNIPSKFICFSQIICKFAHRLLVNKYLNNKYL